MPEFIHLLKEKVNEVQHVTVDEEILLKFSREDDFNKLGFDLLKEAGSYLIIASCLMPETKYWNRDQAIIGGNAVRLYKLIAAFLDQVSQRKEEVSFVMMRLIFETIINISYLIKNSSKQLFDSYVFYSLQNDKKLYDKIIQNIANRGGEKLPIEERMLISIQRTFNKSGVRIEDFNEIRIKDWGDKNIFSKAEDVGLNDLYSAFFKNGSNSIHGNWADLLSYHLSHTELGFEPKFEWKNPRPQTLFAISRLVSEIIIKYFIYIGDAQAIKFIDNAMHNLMDRIMMSDKAHEDFLQKNSS